MNPRIRLVFLLFAGVFATVRSNAQDTRPASRVAPAGLPEGFRLLYDSDLSSGFRGEFDCTDPAAWGPGPGDLQLLRQSRYKPPVRSPRNIALWRGGSLDDFVLEAELQSTGREYGHLDMCLFFGVQARDRFYYAHVAQAADDHAHNLFCVDGKPRHKFASRTTKGIRWGKGQWHRVRLVRDSRSGRTELFFDDMNTPIMVGEDRRFGRGMIGFGSFDDTGKIRKIRIWGRKLGKPIDLGFVSSPRDVRVFADKDRCRIELGGRPFAEYRSKSRLGPLLHPVLGPGGVPMTRSWPVGPWKKGESKDHPHHRSLWFAHGDVDGHDFWSGKDGSHVVQTSLEVLDARGRQGRIRTKNDWLDGEGKLVCRDQRTLTFAGDPDQRILDFDIVLMATQGPLHFGETKEGTMAIRMNPRLRLRGKLARGKALNSEGVRGARVWGKRARWVAYQAPLLPKDPKKAKNPGTAGLALFDHPDNVGYPCHWHARDYGLLAANPFGSRAFGGKSGGGLSGGGKSRDGFTLAGGKTLRLRYRFVFFRGEADRAALDILWRGFANPH